MNAYVVFFACEGGHAEAVLRHGPTRESVAYPDDLDCPVARVVPAGEVEIVAVWEKNGAMRVEVTS